MSILFVARLLSEQDVEFAAHVGLLPVKRGQWDASRRDADMSIEFSRALARYCTSVSLSKSIPGRRADLTCLRQNRIS